jgi:hypothetical protein
MQLFKTEMVFIHPPRTRAFDPAHPLADARPGYGARRVRTLRYGGRGPRPRRGALRAPPCEGDATSAEAVGVDARPCDPSHERMRAA